MAWKPITYRWQWALKSSPDELWPYVADTQRFNHAARLPTINFTEIPLETGGSRRIAHASKWGISVVYEDFPFEWVKGQQFSNLRVFERGPLARTYARLTLEPAGTGTLLTYYAEVTPANMLGLAGIPYQFGWEMSRNFKRVFHQIDEYLQDKIDQPFSLKVAPLGQVEMTRLKQLTRQLAAEGHQLRQVQRLADLLSTESDANLVRLRPYVLADAWQAPRRPILEMFLSAAKLGLLDLRWDIMCPLCRGAKLTASSLDEVQKGVHCATCNIDFEANFTDYVELTFMPNAQIRLVHDGSFCIGGPMVTPHILVHQIIAPGETRTLQTGLGSGSYRIRTQRFGVEQWLELTESSLYSLAKVSIQVDDADLEVSLSRQLASSDSHSSHSDHCTGLRLVMSNQSPDSQRIYVEQGAWYTDAVTAAYVTTLQHYRDLFSDQVLRPDEEIGIKGLTILFSDLVGSTGMYNRWGDAPSYAVVREQFAILQRVVREYEGAIVKTIGDAIMAVFSDQAQGVGAALAIQKEIEIFNAANPTESLAIKLGLHYGPCIAVNLNGRLDYFGATVNLAARLEGQSRGNDVVISEKLRQDPAVAELLLRLPVGETPFETAIKGFDDPLKLYRLTLHDTVPSDL
jgi:class 3 adenylate cyclase